MSYPQYDAIIIGGGLGGLVSAATLSKRGKKVLLLEQHYVIGGCATTFKRKDFIMEVGLHEMDGLYERDIKNDIFDYLDIKKNVDLLQVPEVYNFKSNDLDFVLPHGHDAALNALVEKFPHERKNIEKFLLFMDAILSELPSFPVDKWKQYLNLPFMPLTYPNVVKASKKTLGEWLDHYFDDDNLKLVLQANLLYYHDDPYSMSMIYFSAAQTSYISGGGYFIKGGSQKLSDYLKEFIEENSGTVLLGQKVKNIIIENKVATGVVFQDAFNPNNTKKVSGKKIIANCAVPVVKKMLPNEEAIKLGKKIDHLKPACSLLSIYIGFKSDIKKLGSKYYSTFFNSSSVKNINEIYANANGDYSERNYVFVDYSQIDSELAPQNKSFGVICCADYLKNWENLSPEEYKIKKEEVSKIFIDRLNDHIPGIANEIEYYELATSKTINRYTGNPFGTPYGFAQTPNQSGMGRNPLQSPVKNLHFAGAWTFPGGGFTGAIISGFLCANQVDKSINSKKLTNSNVQDNRLVKLIEKKNIAQNTVELVYEKPDNFDYDAGQYAILELIDPPFSNLDVPHRPLSIVSHPSENKIKFTMRYSNSSFKKSISELIVNDYSKIYGPLGKFTVKNATKGIAFIVSGIGITPILPLLMELKEKEYKEPIYLFYSNKTEESAAYHEDFLKMKLDNFNYVPVFTSKEKRIDSNFLNEYLHQWGDFHYYIVGSSEFSKSLVKQLSCNPFIEQKDIKVDDFG
ncbi:FAD-dependent oxidoreductase [Flammeovirga yaeyamensis]|uniref:FAD-dependent oxidoreductase n=1 Tax=Flammeovirga yaeyamensis TaxID=367791 RepID=A0AAX1N2M7_9BACT|nr:FAD-dependent oxidoreductase [Flammeovirga yaeyamensis]MBB3698116.1 phytoene dehydrogenase-like protein/ferredoxin-NADP reductase [Flammeovirga yaeyamensis]NMF34525.1 NAD(P)-binding protein [Flammeovirga yaeyamensis]QWG01502.1 FAD-dependent oxidoreductase [Flammeovirga yaeyamensis]